MEWWEKEDIYARRWVMDKQAKDIWKYVPERLNEAILDAEISSDGYWLWLADEYRAYDLSADCGAVHEYTIADLRKAIKTIKKIK